MVIWPSECVNIVIECVLMNHFLLGSGCVAVDGCVGSVVVLNSTARERQTALNVRTGTVQQCPRCESPNQFGSATHPAALSEEVFTALRAAVWLGSTGLPHRPSCGAASPIPAWFQESIQNEPENRDCCAETRSSASYLTREPWCRQKRAWCWRIRVWLSLHAGPWRAPHR